MFSDSFWCCLCWKLLFQVILEKAEIYVWSCIFKTLKDLICKLKLIKDINFNPLRITSWIGILCHSVIYYE